MQTNQVNKSKIVSLEKGKLPPQDVGLEVIILGGMLIDKKGVDDCLEVIKTPDVFYKDAHKNIFEAISYLYNKAEGVDIVTVSEQLKKKKLLEASGGDYYLVQLTQKVSSAAHIEFHSRIVLQKFIQREYIRFANQLLESSYDDSADVFDMMEQAEINFTKISEMINRGKSEVSWADAINEVPKRVEFLTNNSGDVTGVTTGLVKLDKWFGGWQPTDLIVIGARPGMGKTAFTINNMIKAAQSGKVVGFMSLEMSAIQLATRGVAVNSNYHMRQLNQTGFEHPKYFKGLNDLVNVMAELPIHIDDRPGLNIGEMKAKARSWKRKYGLDILIVDYIQLADGHSDVRIRTGETSRGLKHIAKELEIPVIGLSQLSRGVETRGGSKRPLLSDLKEAGDIEQDADIVGFLYRPAYYGFECDYEILEQDENTEFIVAKNRNGGIGTEGIWFEENKTKFMDYSPMINREDDEVDF
ncbi:MAG: replicative DNA helicase [Flavobacteriaceae bacterium]|nr:replicative DNA helicase [Flavobacteriaceae bacterium]|tara:strand:- start:25088 stop:26494 length:1407 start_codon:yes stop_codon:yes gene_type:complete